MISCGPSVMVHRAASTLNWLPGSLSPPRTDSLQSNWRLHQPMCQQFELSVIIQTLTVIFVSVGGGRLLLPLERGFVTRCEEEGLSCLPGVWKNRSLKQCDHAVDSPSWLFDTMLVAAARGPVRPWPSWLFSFYHDYWVSLMIIRISRRHSYSLMIIQILSWLFGAQAIIRLFGQEINSNLPDARSRRSSSNCRFSAQTGASICSDSSLIYLFMSECGKSISSWWSKFPHDYSEFTSCTSPWQVCSPLRSVFSRAVNPARLHSADGPGGSWHTGRHVGRPWWSGLRHCMVFPHDYSAIGCSLMIIRVPSFDYSGSLMIIRVPLIIRVSLWLFVLMIIRVSSWLFVSTAARRDYSATMPCLSWLFKSVSYLHDYSAAVNVSFMIIQHSNVPPLGYSLSARPFMVIEIIPTSARGYSIIQVPSWLFDLYHDYSAPCALPRLFGVIPVSAARGYSITEAPSWLFGSCRDYSLPIMIIRPCVLYHDYSDYTGFRR